MARGLVMATVTSLELELELATATDSATVWGSELE